MFFHTLIESSAGSVVIGIPESEIGIYVDSEKGILQVLFIVAEMIL